MIWAEPNLEMAMHSAITINTDRSAQAKSLLNSQPAAKKRKKTTCRTDEKSSFLKGDFFAAAIRKKNELSASNIQLSESKSGLLQFNIYMAAVFTAQMSNRT
ncbi:hypothetical protein PBF_01630 [Cytobacillus firmus DS1]|uniref:Uncharacterized protein n=1 Tax=Cytobacillus firmus DS1 TaxID=1307436 RepID=W7L3Q4_CYTFI|nr:hypothetical protein PBF_01630 [Cytobacillus firmus DS1]